MTAGGRCAAWLRSARAAAGGAAVHAEPRERRGARRTRGDDVVRGRRHADARGQLVPQPQEHRRQRGLRHQLRPNDRPRRARHRRLPARRPGESAGVGRSRARVQIAAATLSGNSLRQTVHTHRASVHQAAKLAAALLRRKVMAAYRRVCDSRQLQTDCQEPESAPEPYARYSSMCYLYFFSCVFASRPCETFTRSPGEEGLCFAYIYFLFIYLLVIFCLQCFVPVGWAAGRARGL